MDNFENGERIRELRRKVIDALCPLIVNDYVLLDFPNYGNIGDNLIWKGQLEFLSTYVPYKKVYSSNYYTFQSDKVPAGVTILLSGGGNWGDIYPSCQIFRTSIVKRFPNNPVIVFPQSVFYTDRNLLEKEALIFNNHSNLHICVRDCSSYDILAEFIDKEKLLLLPDMAFFLNFDNEVAQRTGKTLIMLREDLERCDYYNLDELKSFIEGDPIIKDWPNYKVTPFGKKLHHYSQSIEWKISNYMAQNSFLSRFIHPEYGLKSRDNLESYTKMGVKFMKGYDKVASTRLHGLILAILLNKPVFVLDNNYGKCRNFYDTWLKDFSNVFIMENSTY